MVDGSDWGDGTVGGWAIVTREFRENLEWAAVVEGESGVSAAVATLLEELVGRGIAVRRYSYGKELGCVLEGDDDSLA